MAIDDNGSSSGLNVFSKETMQISNNRTDESASLMSIRSMELEARYQQLLEHRIVALEKQIALTEPAKEDLAAVTVSETDAKLRNDEQSSIGTIEDVCLCAHDFMKTLTIQIDDKVHSNSKLESSSRGQKMVMIWDENELVYIPEAPKTKDEETTQVKANPATEKEYAFIFFEYYKDTPGRVYESSKIVVYSKELIGILRESLGPDGGTIGDDAKVYLLSPYQPIVYSWDKLLKRTVPPGRSEDPDLKPESERAEKSREGLAALLEYIRTSRDLKDYFKNRDTDIAKQVISYKYLWTLFPPATKVVASPFMGIQQLFLEKGQVIVDDGAWYRWAPGHETPNMGHMTAYPIDPNLWRTFIIHQHSLHSIAWKDFDDRCKDGNLLDEEYALLPPRVLGYIPVRRIFAQLAVKDLSPIENKDKDEVWESDLILKEDKKKIIRTLVENHAHMADQRIPDLVEGKGKGLVILLHGPPGVGKSLTAECVAKVTSKPLLTVGVADIGTESKTVEVKLNVVFSLAAEWDAVLLIDEADVFMEQRGSTDSTLERNALVSVLLRVLEYYEGILILTTNRVLSFDVAVQSRINLAVMFHDLDEDQTQSIIKVHMDKRLHNLSENDFYMFAMLASAASLNGRQIRNVISSAEAIVNRTETKRITMDDIKTVLNHTKEFQLSLQEYTKQQRANNEAQGRKGI
ncbi:MAG: hypothetical protein Q9166_006782 [cf. Caloplaca sp. 2 TL-2023]